MVLEDDQILHILSSLGNEYDPVMVSITSRADPCSLREVHAMLLTFESRLEPLLSPAVNTDGSTPTVNTITQSPPQRMMSSSNFQSNYGRDSSVIKALEVAEAEVILEDENTEEIGCLIRTYHNANYVTLLGILQINVFIDLIPPILDFLIP